MLNSPIKRITQKKIKHLSFNEFDCVIRISPAGFGQGFHIIAFVFCKPPNSATSIYYKSQNLSSPLGGETYFLDNRYIIKKILRTFAACEPIRTN